MVLDFQDNDGTIPNLNIEVVTEATGTFATLAIPTGSPMKPLLLTSDAPAPAQPKKKRKLKQCKHCKESRARPCALSKCRKLRAEEEQAAEDCDSPAIAPRPRAVGKRQPNMDGNSAIWHRERQHTEAKEQAKRKEARKKYCSRTTVKCVSMQGGLR